MLTNDAGDVSRPRRGWFESIVTRLGEGIIAVDRQGRVDFLNPAAEALTGWRGGVVPSWNGAAERLFGYTAGEMVGRPITLIFPMDRLAEEVDFLGRLAKGERIENYDTIRVRKDGTPVDVSVTLSPIRDGSGRIVAVSKIARDVTARKRAEQDRAELLRREQAALHESLTLNR